MGLSRSEKDGVTVLQLLTEIANGLSVLNDPKALAKASKDAYALPEAEQVKADAARANIAELDAKIAEQRQSQIALEAAGLEHDKRKIAADQSADKLAVKIEDIRSRETQLKSDIATNKKIIKEIEVREQSIVSDAAILDERKKFLDARESVIADQESALKAKLKVLSEGL